MSDPEDIAQALDVASTYRVGDDLPRRLEHARDWQERQAVLMAEAAIVIRNVLGEMCRQAIELTTLRAELWMWRNGVHPSQEGTDAMPGNGS